MNDILKSWEEIDELTDKEKAIEEIDKTYDLIYAIYRLAIKNYNYNLCGVEKADFIQLLDFIIFDLIATEENSKESEVND